MSEALLKISNVTAGYGNISVLHEVSLDMSNS
jgi:ABC-type branched-subunit amino acid transport system ATPase component